MPGGSRGRRWAAGLVAALFAGTLGWTLIWYLAHGASALAALADPLAAPRALWQWPAAARPDLRLLASGATSLAVGAALTVAAVRPRAAGLYGDARFATRGEARAQGLLASSGVLLGRWRGLWPAYLRHGGPLHVLLAAPTRSGKGVGVVLPNLLSWPGSAVVLDVKNESFAATSGFRAAGGQRVFRFAPGDPERRTHRYNPLDAVRRSPEHRIADLQAVAHLLAPEASGEQKMWHQEARSLFVGLCLYILDTPGLTLTFGQVARVLAANVDLREALAALIERRADSLDPVCLNLLSSFIHKAPKERSGVKSTLTGSLELWADPAIDAATAASDFSFEELRRVPTTVYVSVSLDQLERVAFLLNIVFQQLVGVATRHVPDAREPWPVLAVIDEFAALGRMDLVVDKMPFLAGFNLRLLLVVQGLAQLDRLYGAAGREIVLQNAGLQIFFASNDEATSRYVSARLGTRTVEQRTRSRSTPMLGGGAGSVTRSVQLHARPLLSPDEVRRLGADRAVLFAEGGRPVLAAKIVHYRDAELARRVMAPVEVAATEAPQHRPFRFASETAAGSDAAAGLEGDGGQGPAPDLFEPGGLAPSETAALARLDAEVPAARRPGVGRRLGEAGDVER